jgi:hypothetical protein
MNYADSIQFSYELKVVPIAQSCMWSNSVTYDVGQSVLLRNRLRALFYLPNKLCRQLQNDYVKNTQYRTPSIRASTSGSFVSCLASGVTPSLRTRCPSRDSGGQCHEPWTISRIVGNTQPFHVDLPSTGHRTRTAVRRFIQLRGNNGRHQIRDSNRMYSIHCESLPCKNLVTMPFVQDFQGQFLNRT